MSWLEFLNLSVIVNCATKLHLMLLSMSLSLSSGCFHQWLGDPFEINWTPLSRNYFWEPEPVKKTPCRMEQEPDCYYTQNMKDIVIDESNCSTFWKTYSSIIKLISHSSSRSIVALGPIVSAVALSALPFFILSQNQNLFSLIGADGVFPSFNKKIIYVWSYLEIDARLYLCHVVL